jgi:hypothetical protein
MKNNNNYTYLTILISIVLIAILYFSRYKNIENNLPVVETRKFSVLNELESSKLISEIENKYILWDTDGSQRVTDEQPFEGWKISLSKSIPKLLEPSDTTIKQLKMIYFPSTFKPKYPMYYKSVNKPVSYFYPKKNSMIVITEPIEWIGDTNQVVIVGIKSSEQLSN